MKQLIGLHVSPPNSSDYCTITFPDGDTQSWPRSAVERCGMVVPPRDIDIEVTLTVEEAEAVLKFFPSSGRDEPIFTARSKIVQAVRDQL